MSPEELETMRALLVILLALPTAAAIVVALLGQNRGEVIRWVSLASVLANLVLAAILAYAFCNLPTEAGPRTTFRPEFVPGAVDELDRHATTWAILPLGTSDGIQFYLGLDGINLWLVVLTQVLMVASVLISWTSVAERVNEYYAWLLVLGTAMTGVFLSFDIILFYVFFELTLVPLFFLIGIWGGPDRRHAARKFFIYTLAGSLITLLGVLAVVVVCSYPEPYGVGRLTFSLPDLVQTINDKLNAPRSNADFWYRFQVLVFLALIAGFAIKVPLVPFHTWLPLAHTEAPTAGSVLLAGVLLKIGTYGFLRLCLPLAPDASIHLGLPLIGTLAVIGILYGAFCSLAQDDIKKLIAYSSVSHLGFCMLGLFALNEAGLTGGLLQMLNHGLSTGGLFLVVGMLYERYHTRRIADYGGMGARLGLLTCCMIFFALTSVGLPGLNGFVGEAMVFLGMFETNHVLAVIGTGGIILGAWYLLTMIRYVFFGAVHEPHSEGHGVVRDLTPREWLTVGPIMALCLLLGVYPQPVIQTAQPGLQVVQDILKERKRYLAASAAGATELAHTEAAAQGRNDGE